jgi:uncharacterized membrane protein YgcG
MRNIIVKCFFGLVLILFGTTAISFEVPELQGHINDYAQMLDSATKATLEQRLTEFETRTSVQMVVLTIDNLDGTDLESAAIQTANTWKLGQDGKNNGILIFIPKRNRQIRIEVGSGIEDVVTDTLAGSIIDNMMMPSFKAGRFDLGISNAINKLTLVIEGAPQAEQKGLAKQNHEQLFEYANFKHKTRALTFIEILAVYLAAVIVMYLFFVLILDMQQDESNTKLRRFTSYFISLLRLIDRTAVFFAKVVIYAFVLLLKLFGRALGRGVPGVLWKIPGPLKLYALAIVVMHFIAKIDLEHFNPNVSTRIKALPAISALTLPFTITDIWTASYLSAMWLLLLMPLGFIIGEIFFSVATDLDSGNGGGGFGSGGSGGNCSGGGGGYSGGGGGFSGGGASGGW